MSTDSQKEASHRGIPDWWRLPKITDIRIRRAPYEPKEYKYIKSDFAEYDEVVELMVEYEGDFPVSRAVGPIMYIGEVPVGEVELLEGKRARFLAFQPEKLEQGAPIFIGWPGDLERRNDTGFQYDL